MKGVSLTNKTEAKFQKMTNESIYKLLAVLSAPAIGSMLITSVYNAADSYFVSSLGDSATGSIGVIFSFMSIIQAFGFMFGHGAGNYMSRQLGKRDYDSAGKIAVTAVVYSFITGLLLEVFGLIFIERLAVFLGSTDTILPYAKEYLRFILYAAPFQTTALTLNNQLRFQGNAKYGMMGLGSGAILNMCLDPIFIYVFGMGVTGAGLATMISQITGFVILVVCTFFGGNMPIKLNRFTPSGAFIKEILAGGIPSFCRNVIGSVATILLNYALKANSVGDGAIAAMTVVSRISWLLASIIIGIGQGFQPICGINYGAKKYGRVLRAFRVSIIISTAVLCVGGFAAIIFAGPIVSLFTTDSETIAVGVRALRYQCIPAMLSACYVIGGMMLQNLGRSFRATLLAVCRQGLIFIPLILVLPRFLGLEGALVAQPAADFITAFISLPLFLPEVKSLMNKQKAQEQSSD